MKIEEQLIGCFNLCENQQQQEKLLNDFSNLINDLKTELKKQEEKRKVGIINPFKCEGCERKLQPENIGIGVIKGELTRICLFCNYQIKITKQEEK